MTAIRKIDFTNMHLDESASAAAAAAGYIDYIVAEAACPERLRDRLNRAAACINAVARGLEDIDLLGDAPAGNVVENYRELAVELGADARAAKDLIQACLKGAAGNTGLRLMLLGLGEAAEQVRHEVGMLELWIDDLVANPPEPVPFDLGPVDDEKPACYAEIRGA